MLDFKENYFSYTMPDPEQSGGDDSDDDDTGG